MVKGITSGLMLNMYKYGSSKKINKDEMFASISVAIGGDGKTISRTQLKNFIEKADNKEIKVGQKELKAYKMFDSSWDTVFGKDTETITVEDFEKAPHLFANIITSRNEKSEDEKFSEELREKVKKYLEDMAEKINGSKDKPVTIDQIKERLEELLKEKTDSEKSDENSEEEIALLINILDENKQGKQEFKA